MIFSRSNYISFDASRQEKHDAGKINVVSTESKAITENYFRKNGYFWGFCSLEAKPLILDGI